MLACLLFPVTLPSLEDNHSRPAYPTDHSGLFVTLALMVSFEGCFMSCLFYFTLYL